MTVERKKKTPFGGHKGPHGSNQITKKGGKLRKPNGRSLFIPFTDWVSFLVQLDLHGEIVNGGGKTESQQSQSRYQKDSEPAVKIYHLVKNVKTTF